MQTCLQFLPRRSIFDEVKDTNFLLTGTDRPALLARFAGVLLLIVIGASNLFIKAIHGYLAFEHCQRSRPCGTKTAEDAKGGPPRAEASARAAHRAALLLQIRVALFSGETVGSEESVEKHTNVLPHREPLLKAETLCVVRKFLKKRLLLSPL